MTEATYSPSALPAKLAVKIRVDEAGCWLWTGYIGQQGYGRRIWPPTGAGKAKNHQIHRLVYELLVEPIPAGFVLDHRCKVRHCCNPAHMEVVTPEENSGRAYSGGRPNKDGMCRRGLHPYVPPNIYVEPNTGRRRCYACMLEKARQQKAATKHPERTRRPGAGQGSLLG